MKKVLMMKGAAKVVDVCARVRAGEKVVVVTDMETMSVAEAVSAASLERDAEVVVLVMTPRKLDGQEPPEPVAAALRRADVIFTPVKRSITHTDAVKNAVKAGARGIMMTAFTERMLIEGGIEADFEAIKPTAEKLASLLAGARTARLTTPAGTDITMSVEGRPGNAHTGIVGPGQMSTVPNIEASISPVEGTAEGVIVADASIPYYEIGLLSEPVRFEVRKGMVVSIAGGAQAQKLKKMLEEQQDPNVYNIAQLSFGLNPKCTMQGIMLEDEGVAGTSHIGIGTSTVLGGKIKTSMHFDALMWSPTLELDGRTVMVNGQLVV